MPQMEKKINAALVTPILVLDTGISYFDSVDHFTVWKPSPYIYQRSSNDNGKQNTPAVTSAILGFDIHIWYIISRGQ